MHSCLLVAPFVTYSQKNVKGRQEETAATSPPPPLLFPVPRMCGPWQRGMDFSTRLAAARGATLAMLTHYKGKPSAPCQILSLLWQRRARFHRLSVCREEAGMVFRKCPITGGLLLPVGFPLEQLSVSVSLGKPQKHSANGC